MFTTVFPNLSTLLIVMVSLFIVVSLISIILSFFVSYSGEKIATFIFAAFCTFSAVGWFLGTDSSYEAAQDNLALINDSGVTVLSDDSVPSNPLNDMNTYSKLNNAVDVSIKINDTGDILSCKIIPDSLKTFSVLCEAPEETSSGLIPLDELVSSN